MVRGGEVVECVEVAIEGIHDLVLEMRSLIGNPSQFDAEGGEPTHQYLDYCIGISRSAGLEPDERSCIALNDQTVLNACICRVHIEEIEVYYLVWLVCMQK